MTDRTGRVAATVAVPVLVVAAVVNVMVGDGSMLWTVALTVVTSAWLLAMAAVHPRWSSGTRCAHHAGLLVLMSALVAVDPYAMFASWVLAVQAFVLFSARWAFVWAAAGGVLMTVAQGRFRDGVSSVPLVISLISPILVAGWQVGRESEARRRIAAELAEANRALTGAAEREARLKDRLLAQARAVGVRDERHRIARELHDTVTQDLSAVVTLLETATAGGEPVTGPVARARDVARSGLVEARRAVRALGSLPLDEVALPVALERLVADWSERTGIDARFRGDPAGPRVGDEAGAALYRITQSALANVAEHARATRVAVTLSVMDGTTRVDIRDDGIGFHPDGPAADRVEGRGFGLVAMRQRVAELGGSLVVESTPGTGTAVCATVPADCR